MAGTTAFLGLGQMGSAMAANLIKAGHRVRVWNRTPAAADKLVREGAERAATPAEAARDASVVFTMLANDEAVESVAFGDHGFAPSLAAEAIHVSMSTISVALAETLVQQHRDRGQAFISAPVFGRPEAAAAAKLFIAVAGASTSIVRVAPLLEAMGQRIFVMGEEPAQANLIKLTGNFLITCVIESLAEAYTLTEKAGIDPARLHELLTETLFAAPIYKIYGKMILDRKYEPPGFSMPLGQKDNRLIQQAAEKLEVPLPLAGLIRDRFLAALANGDEALDWSAFAKRAAADAGLKHD